MDSSTESWESIADEWVAHADTNDYRNALLMPLTLGILGDVRGRSVLDIGCGEGGYARELARRGATVVGIDGSERLIEVARQRAAAANIHVAFVCANAKHMANIGSDAFDVVLAAMSLMDVEDYSGAIAEAYRVLRHGGDLLMSITHPCFTAPVSMWIKDDAGQAKFFAVDRYVERSNWEDRIARSFSRPVVRRHRPLEDYIAAPLEAGFALREFREPSASDEDLKKSARFWKLKRIPYFLLMRWAKP